VPGFAELAAQIPTLRAGCADGTDSGF